MPGQRLDKWLFFARIIKSRSLAARLIADGKVRVNRVRLTRPSHLVQVGDVVTAAIHSRVRVAKVLAEGVRRGPAPEAQRLYEEILQAPSDPRSPAVGLAGERPQGAGRPTKRERRVLEAWVRASEED